MRRKVCCLIGVAVPLLLASGGPATACAALDWTRVAGDRIHRPLEAEDLVALRDVGPLDDEQPDKQVLALSPDGSRVAFQLRQADPTTNRYCLAIVVVAVDGSPAPIFVDRGGELIRRSIDEGVEPVRRTGLPAIITPVWSADGRSLFFLRQDGGRIQLWHADVAGGGSRALTSFSGGVLAFRIDGAHAIVRLPGDHARARASRAREADVGFHLDERSMPLHAVAPSIRVEPGAREAAIDLATGAIDGRAVQDLQRSGSEGEGESSPPGGATGCRAVRLAEGSGVPPATRIALACPGAPPLPCPETACTATSGPLWLAREGRAIRFMRREGWARTRTAVHEWVPATSRVEQLFATEASLIDCRPRSTAALVCLRESALQPRHLVRIDLASRRVTTLADFNPEFTGLALGARERLPLRSSAGLEAFADLVLPVGYRPGRRYPLIVVQYQSRGFLRGGTGDEFPIQLFANAGFAVLSVQRPPPVGITARPPDYIAVDRIGLADFADRRSVLSVVEAGVNLAIARGIADPAAIGITGLSDGSSTVQFAALNSRLFSAAIVSGCCWEPGQTALLGPAAASIYARIGWPGIAERADAFWSRLSIVRNADRVNMPFLFEMADEEFRGALPSYTALRERDRPADFFVFPDEHHIKWQPVHRLAAYVRALDWFNYWLRGISPEDLRRRAEVARWAEMDRRPPCPVSDSASAASSRPTTRPCLRIEQQ